LSTRNQRAAATARRRSKRCELHALGRQNRLIRADRIDPAMD
jgi:hypothetical protein